MHICRTSSSHTVNSGNRNSGAKVAFCFLTGFSDPLPAAAAEAPDTDAVLADLVDLADLPVRAAVFSVLADAERDALEDDVLLDALVPEVPAELGEVVLLPSSYLAACARDVPAALSAS